jgi:hypothetical protein
MPPDAIGKEISADHQRHLGERQTRQVPSSGVVSAPITDFAERHSHASPAAPASGSPTRRSGNAAQQQAARDDQQ